MADDIEVHIDFALGMKRVGTLRRQPRRGGEATSFEYHPDWLGDSTRFSLEPALTLNRGAFAPAEGFQIFGSIGDSAPDTWGRRLMQRAERRRADREGRAVRTLMEADYLLGVADVSRLGALRFRLAGENQFQAQTSTGVPSLIELGRLLQVTERILRDEESDEDLQLIFAPGSSLGGARPKASVIDQHGRLAIAKFPKETDDYSVELWEAVALRLAAGAGIRTPEHELIRVADKPVLLSRRFDRVGGARVPFLSALSMMGLKDGDHGSYPELVDVLTQYGAGAARDAHELYRRMIFNILISNVDDHLRNHGFLWAGQAGWTLSPAYDLNPTPTDMRRRILTTNITLDEGTCDLELALSVAGYFGLGMAAAKAIVKEVAASTATWRDVAAALGARSTEIRRMESAFDHDDLAGALAL
ncbi:type II toxin-antitoxin system HipA family toxin [Magnetospirillum sp. SS-4]|uniref:type II toxin-antitoxin system HipA family toxin n=1 Tax=Magnetospirillum sp. SS-4 TaxID=2681465 RepID=UPI00137C55B3|nr:type II toxin-antitoxin system HipA family toxin [Magnetospirillum sp. SS-4]CAA7627619.1 HipA domain protein [Magnetospirillum sp. SS-4]